MKDNRIWFGEDGGNVPRIKRFLSEVRKTVTPTTIWKHADVGHSQGATQRLKALFDGKAYFDYPKPVGLVMRCLELYSEEDSIILDFFAGSGTAAHAVLRLNAEDGGNRKFIMVQLPEPCDKKSDAFKAGYKTIAEIGKERVRRAAKKIADEGNSEIDLGFKAFKLDRSNFKVWQGDAEKLADERKLAEQLSMHVDHIDKASTAEDILYELLLKAGYPLTTKVSQIQLAGKQVFSIEDGALLICLEKEITTALVDALAESDPRQVICLDAAFQGNDQLKTNAVQTFKSRAESQETEIIFKTV